MDGALPALEGDGRRRKTSEDLARSVAAYIVDNGLAEGDKLPSEESLRLSFGVGRTTVREAMRLLETQGVILVKAGPRGGPVVRRPRPDDLRSALTLQLQFRNASFAELLDARLALEPPLAAAAARNARPDDIDRLRRTVESAEGRATRLGAPPGHHDFHRVIAGLAGNAVLEVYAATLLSIFSTERPSGGHNERRQASIDDAHRGVLDAIVARDEDAAAQAMYDHLAEGIRWFKKRYSELLNQPVRWV